jgi:C_GCAxxG_C_C family probable redox protein
MIKYYHIMTRSSSRPASPGDAIGEVRARFLAEGSPYGCAETALTVLQRAFGLDDASDGAAAMALNGGVAYSGGTCGAITGAAMALGLLAEQRIPDRGQAKRAARELAAGMISEFEATFGATDCRTLIGVDLRAPGGHDAFMAAGAWRTDCLRRLELVVERLAPLADPATFDASTARLAAEAAAASVPQNPGSAAEAPARR